MEQTTAEVEENYNAKKWGAKPTKIFSGAKIFILMSKRGQPKSGIDNIFSPVFGTRTI